MNWRGGERDSFTNSLRCTTMQIFFSSLRSNAYEFDKTEMRFHLRKSVVTLEKKISRLTEHSSDKNLGSSKRLVQEN